MGILKYKKIYINKGIKEKIWLMHFGKNFEVDCPSCNIRKLNPFSFSTGHIIPEFKGGLPTVDNLIPICSHCNSRMGIKNYYEYKDQILKK